MNKFLKIFFWGLGISFLGSLPLGTLNVAAMQIGIQESITNAMYFSAGSLLVEMFYVRLSLVGLDWIRKQEKIMKIMNWLTLAIVIFLAVGSFMAATKGDADAKNTFLENNIHRFLLGMGMCAITPAQIPFWFGWSTVLFSKKILEPNASHYNSYIVGIGIGTFLGNCIFIFGGRLMVQKIQGSASYINWVIGSIFAITAVIQLWRIIKHKDAVSQFEEKNKLK